MEFSTLAMFKILLRFAIAFMVSMSTHAQSIVAVLVQLHQEAIAGSYLVMGLAKISQIAYSISCVSLTQAGDV